jgi:hypothetical protein
MGGHMQEGGELTCCCCWLPPPLLPHSMLLEGACTLCGANGGGVFMRGWVS